MNQWIKQFWTRCSNPDQYHLISWLFLRGLAVIYIAAFASMYVQIKGLVGAEGILPLIEKLSYIREAVGLAGVWKFPSLFWVDRLLYKLKQGAPNVTALFEHNPFSDQLPGYVWVSFYRYRYTTPSVRATTGRVWTREYLGSYTP